MSLKSDALEFAPALLAIQESPPPKLPRAALLVVCALSAAMLLWACVGRLDIVAVAEGRLVPQTYVKIVQPADAGVISEILVAEGDFVRAGQTLIRLDSTLTQAEARNVETELALRRLVLRRIDAELAERSMRAQPSDPPELVAQVVQQGIQRAQAYRDALAQETAQLQRLEQDLRAATETHHKLQATVPSYQQTAAAYRSLANEGLVPALSGSEKEREAIEKAQDLKAQAAVVIGIQQSIAGQQGKVAALRSNYRSQLQAERTEALAAVARLEQEQRKSDYKQQILELKAPQDGIAKDLATTTKGAVVQPGMVLLTLVPRGDKLVAEVLVRNEDIATVRKGQQVKLKLAAYPFQKHGLVDGRVLQVAADARPAGAAPQFVGAEQAASSAGYRVLVDLLQDVAPPGSTSSITQLEPGMVVTAEIHQGTRTVMEYLLSPVVRTAKEAARER